MPIWVEHWIPQQLKQQSADIMCSSFTNKPPNHSPLPEKTTIFATLLNRNITLLKLWEQNKLMIALSIDLYTKDQSQFEIVSHLV